MGGGASKHRNSEDLRTDGHKDILKIFTELTPDQTLTEGLLANIFPKRSLFTRCFIQWMESLSYKKNANRESFVFACEILSLDPEQVLKAEYKNHTFGHLEIFLHMTLLKMPNKIEQVTLEETTAYIDLILNFFMGDDIDGSEGREVIIAMITKRTEIENGPISYHTLLKSNK